jgi:hypothetical protein
MTPALVINETCCRTCTVRAWITDSAIEQQSPPQGRTLYRDTSLGPVVRLQVESLIPYELSISYNPVDAVRWLTHNKGHPRLSVRERAVSLCQLSFCFHSWLSQLFCQYYYTLWPMSQQSWCCGTCFNFCVETVCLCASCYWLLLVGDRTSFHVLSIS